MRSNQRSIIFICHTYHHVVISLIKAMKSNDLCDIAITSHIPDYLILAEKIRNEGIISQLFLIDSNKLDYSDYKNNSIWKLFYLHRDNYLRNKNIIYIDFNKYDDIYIFNDWTNEGHFLQDAKVKYHLIEDGVDHFKHINKYVPNYYKYIKPTLHNLLKYILNYGYSDYGTSKYCIDIEVNNNEDLHVRRTKKIIQYSKKNYYSTLNDSEINMLLQIFCDESIMVNNGKNRVIILTQPLFSDKVVDSKKMQIDVYRSIVRAYSSDFQIYIKPHPRDMINYKQEFEKAIIINKNIPTEVINFKKELRFEKAITLSSSSIFMFDNVNEKISLGLQYCDKIMNKEKTEDENSCNGTYKTE